MRRTATSEKIDIARRYTYSRKRENADAAAGRREERDGTAKRREGERESLVPESLMGIRLQLLPGISADDDDDDAFFSFQERNVCA